VKKCFSVLVAISLMVITMVPAFAAAPYDADWVPPIPSFIVPKSTGFTLNIDFSSYWDARVCFKTVKVTKGEYRKCKQRHENREPSSHILWQNAGYA